WTCFFFSSRRRHTRSDRDWSSDVCSSDLRALTGNCGSSTTIRNCQLAPALGIVPNVMSASVTCSNDGSYFSASTASVNPVLPSEIGRASCRERGDVSERASVGWRQEQDGG